jgi:galactarate dehydratase
MNLHVFTTGRGTPYGLAAGAGDQGRDAQRPGAALARPDGRERRPHRRRRATIEDVGWEMFRLMLDVASGRKKTWAEHWKLHNALVLFNPAPVT